MAIDTLHRFEDDLRARPSKGSNAPPRTLKAKDLDENFIKAAVIAPQEERPRYSVKYTREGTMLKIEPELPELPESATMHVLTATNGVLAWTPTEACP